MTTTKNTGRGSNVQLQKRIRDLEEANRIKDQQLADAERRAKPPEQLSPPVIADRLRLPLKDQEKYQIIRECRKELEQVFIYATKDMRKGREVEYRASKARLIAALEQWALRASNGQHWKVMELSLVNKGKVKQSTDDLISFTLTHPGFVRTEHGGGRVHDESETPIARPILRPCGVRRYELGA